MSNDKYDYLFKILTIGDSNVDKARFIIRFTSDSYILDKMTTIGVNFVIKPINFANKHIKLQICDTAGEERFRTITKTFYKGANGIIIIYDVTDQYSFKNARFWMKQIEADPDKSIKRVLVGNKCEKPEREVSEEEGKKLADEFNVRFFETSAKTGKNVKEVFYYLVEELLKDKGIFKEEGIKLSNKNAKNKKNGCAK